MSAPLPVEIPHHQMIKIASGVTDLRILKMEGGKSYYQTYRDNGEPAPDLPVNLDNPRDPISSEWLVIPEFNSKFESDVASDIYIFCTDGKPADSGWLRVAEGA